MPRDPILISVLYTQLCTLFQEMVLSFHKDCFASFWKVLHVVSLLSYFLGTGKGEMGEGRRQFRWEPLCWQREISKSPTAVSSQEVLVLSSDVHWVKMKAGRRKGNSSLEEIIYEESSTFGWILCGSKKLCENWAVRQGWCIILFLCGAFNCTAGIRSTESLK